MPFLPTMTGDGFYIAHIKKGDFGNGLLLVNHISHRKISKEWFALGFCWVNWHCDACLVHTGTIAAIAAENHMLRVSLFLSKTVWPQIVSAKAVQNPYFLWVDYADVGQLLSCKHCKHCKQSNFRYFRSATEVVAPLHRRIWNTWRRRLQEVAVGWSAVVLFFEDRQIAIGLVSNWSMFGVDQGKYTHLSWFQYYVSIFQWIYT